MYRLIEDIDEALSTIAEFPYIPLGMATVAAQAVVCSLYKYDKKRGSTKLSSKEYHKRFSLTKV